MLSGLQEDGNQRNLVLRLAVRQCRIKNVCNVAIHSFGPETCAENLTELCDNQRSLVVRAMLQHDFEHEVAVLIREQHPCVGEKSVNQPVYALIMSCPIPYELTEDTAAILKACARWAGVRQFRGQFIDDEGHILQWQYLDHLLRGVVGMDRIHCLTDATAQIFRQLCCRAGACQIQGLVYHPAARPAESKFFHQAFLLQFQQSCPASVTTSIQLRHQFGSKMLASILFVLARPRSMYSIHRHRRRSTCPSACLRQCPALRLADELHTRRKRRLHVEAAPISRCGKAVPRHCTHLTTQLPRSCSERFVCRELCLLLMLKLLQLVHRYMCLLLPLQLLRKPLRLQIGVAYSNNMRVMTSLPRASAIVPLELPSRLQ
mmetsp:Transcript_50394/g.126962  ORF Transcript_50394/g.126962 Transcript_50394/m.126962 type:complete len:375 (+) Transcript_50394:301-1425(+)